MIIVLSGPIASGKSTIAKRAARLAGAHHASFGDYVRHLAGSEGFSQRAVLRKIGQSLVETNPAGFVRDFLLFAKFHPGQPFIVDGLRHHSIWIELSKLASESHDKIFLAYVEIEAAIRRQRLRDRGLTDIDIELIDDDPSEYDVLHILKAEANIVINGGGSADTAATLLISEV